MMEPKEGLLTFRGEGNNIRGDIYYSRMIHFPVNYNACTGALSGVTIGRGYDLGGRSVSEVLSDLLFSGLSVEQAKKISRGAKLRGCQAAKFVKEKKRKHW